MAKYVYVRFKYQGDSEIKEIAGISINLFPSRSPVVHGYWYNLTQHHLIGHDMFFSDHITNLEYIDEMTYNLLVS
jgi:hypothetical protein